MKINLCLFVSVFHLTAGAKTRTYNPGGFAVGQNAGAAVNNLLGAKVSAVGGFFAGLVTGQSANTGGHYNTGGNYNTGGGHYNTGGGCGVGGVGGCNTGGSYNTGSSHNSGCGSHGCNTGSSYSSGCGSHGCNTGGSSYSSGSSYGSSGCGSHGCGSSNVQVIATGSGPAHAPAVSYNNYPDCQCDWLFNDHGQGNCNVGASSHTNDRWCYVKTKVNGKWVDPQWSCPDSRASTVHHGKYWSNIACNTPQHG